MIRKSKNNEDKPDFKEMWSEVNKNIQEQDAEQEMYHDSFSVDGRDYNLTIPMSACQAMKDVLGVSDSAAQTATMFCVWRCSCSSTTSMPPQRWPRRLAVAEVLKANGDAAKTMTMKGGHALCS